MTLQVRLRVIEVRRRAAVEQVLDGAVDDQVRIAADGRGEMGVGGIGEPEVAHVVGAVHGLLHGAQQHGLDQMPVRPCPRPAPAAPRSPWPWASCSPGSLSPSSPRNSRRSVSFSSLRRLVDAVQGRQLLALEQPRRRHVGRQHALLDDAVSVVAHQRMDRRDASLLVELEAGLGGIEVDGAALGARRVQRLVERIQLVQMGQQFGEALAQVGVTVHHHGRDLVVGEAGVGAHHPPEEPRACDLPLKVDVQLAGHAQAVHLRI